MYSAIIIGAGHAGVEAAVMAAKISLKYGQRAAIITLKEDNFGMMSCNPAIGGIGKGVIVREIDALGGIMGEAIDESSIHSTILNHSKGPAVRGPRAQADRQLYKKSVKSLIERQEGLDIIIDSVEELIYKNNKVIGARLLRRGFIYAHSIVVTTGTFLSGLILIGKKRIKGGRIEENPSYGLSTSLQKLKLEMGRLKTGTPARIYKNSIKWNVLERQEGDCPPVPFSYLKSEIQVNQVPCYITYTNVETHKIMLKHASESPIYTKEITARGPRYCPSIEDKITRFSEKLEHRVFLEPEGLTSDLIYPNGLSTAMSEEVQEKFLRSIKGLEDVKIAKYGYAIEYDFVNPIELRSTLECRKIEGLFLAGQINGTTGYEEAAGQGIVAGINAALFACTGKADFTIDRSEGYIGVMIDDLTSKGVIEPYRMFTSRSEYRLSIRADNADLRLTPKIIALGICEEKRKRLLKEKQDSISHYINVLKSKVFTSTELNHYNLSVSQDGIKRNGFDMLCHPLITYQDVERIFEGKLKDILPEARQQIEIMAKYNFYLEQQKNDITLFKKDENTFIPENFNFRNLKSLSAEVIEKLEHFRPSNISQALRIQGITPAAVMAIIIALRSKAA